MDILAHMLWANYGSRPINKKRVKKSLSKINVAWIMFWSVFPDLFAFGIPTVLAVIVSITSNNFSFKSLLSHHGTPNPLIMDLPAYLYQFSHSFIIWILIFILVWVISKKPQFVLFGWALHIFLDIFSHSIQFYPTPFLFPISNYHFIYGIRWSDPYFVTVNYTLIAIFAIYFYLTRNKKN